MNQQHQGNSHKVQRQIIDRRKALLGKKLGQQAENPKGCEVHKNRHHTHNHIVKILEYRKNSLTRLARLSDRNTHQNRKDNNLQHIAIRHRLDWVGRENTNEYILK